MNPVNIVAAGCLVLIAAPLLAQDIAPVNETLDALERRLELRHHEAVASLMYRAVRLGGIPCSGLPWRWGYGWPECD